MSGNFDQFDRELPAWFKNAKLGIFIHWGAYSVPAWAEPIGALGTIEGETWFAHNPYAEWYWNTIRVSGSPAAQLHAEKYQNQPYDAFLDSWKAEKFSATSWAKLFSSVGARYVIPVTKHHDGIALWDAPGTGTRNTVHRGPKRDLVQEIADAVRAEGMRFGAYYSGGLDWNITQFPPITEFEKDGGTYRPRDAAYSMYAYEHFMDLIHKYKPDVLWNDIEWPDFSKDGDETVPYSLAQLFKNYYDQVADGVVNDRWGHTHSDFTTSEYEMNVDNEIGGYFENCRGIGFSFGYNTEETAEHYLTPLALISHLVDVVSRGGNFLLNVGPKADGELPEIQIQILKGLGDWMKINSIAIHDTSATAEFNPTGNMGQDTPWIRYTRGQDNRLFVILSGRGRFETNVPTEVAVESTGRSLDPARPVEITSENGCVTIDMGRNDSETPIVVELTLR